MTCQVQVKCIICRKLTDPIINSEDEVNAEALNLLHYKLCAAMKLEFSPKREWDLTEEPFPYCESCGQRLQRLGELMDQLKRIEEEISGSLATVSALVITSHKCDTNSSDSDPLIASKSGQGKEYYTYLRLQGKHNYFRSLIIQRFDPRVRVERCDSLYNDPGSSQEYFDYELLPKPLWLIKTEEQDIQGFPDTATEGILFDETGYKIDTSANLTSGVEPKTVVKMEETWAALSEAPALSLVANKVQHPATTTLTSATVLVNNEPSKQYDVTFDEVSETYELGGFKFKEVVDGYECSTCGHVSSLPRGGQRSRSKEYMKMHIKTLHMGARKSHDYRRPRVCSKCDKVFTTSQNLYWHRLKTHRAPAFQCRHCEAKFAIKSRLAEHEIVHRERGPKPYACDVCGVGFVAKRSLNKHLRTFHPESKLSEQMLEQQEQLEESFPGLLEPSLALEGIPDTTVEPTVSHDAEYTIDTSSNSASGVEPETTFGLEEAWTTSLSPTLTLTRVSDQEKIPGTSTCLSTNSDHGSVQNFPSHPYDVTFDEESKTYELSGFKFKELESGCFKCCTCGHVSAVPKGNISKRANIRRHIKNVHISAPRPRYDHGRGLWDCDECGKRCTSIHNLCTHRASAHRSPKFQCSHCGARFAFKWEYKQHMVTHKKERKRCYSCDQCDKSFFTKNNLKVHSLVHTSERREQCSLCGLKFKTRSVLRRHIREVHAKDPLLAVEETERQEEPDGGWGGG